MKVRKSRAKKQNINDVIKTVYREIVTYVQKNNYPPTIKELAESTDFSTYTVVSALHMLEDLNQIKRQPNTARAISLVGVKMVLNESKSEGDNQWL